MHEHEVSGGPFHSDFIAAMLSMKRMQLILDVGTASGRLSRYAENRSSPTLRLLDEAVARGNAKGGSSIQGMGYALPFCQQWFRGRVRIRHSVSRARAARCCWRNAALRKGSCSFPTVAIWPKAQRPMFLRLEKLSVVGFGFGEVSIRRGRW